MSKRSVVCLKVGATAVATWENSAGQTCSFTGLVGSNYGENTVNGGEYVYLLIHNEEKLHWRL
jgi:hypothetical protein